MILGTLWACVQPELHVEATATEAGALVESSRPIDRVELVDARGARVTRRVLATPTRDVTLAVALEPGIYEVRAFDDAHLATTSVTVAPEPPLTVAVQVAPGQPWVPAVGTLRVPVPPGGVAEPLLRVSARAGHSGPISWSGGPPINLPIQGGSAVRAVSAPTATNVQVEDLAFRIEPFPFDLSALSAAVHIAGMEFPANEDGIPEPARDRGRITLAGPVWDAVVRVLGVGTRARDPWAPWGWLGVEVENAGSAPVDLVLTALVTRDGEPDPEFRPRLRGAEGGTERVAILARVPVGGAVVALPIFVVPEATEGPRSVTVTVMPMGSDAVLQAIEFPMVVRRGDDVAAVGFVVSCIACVTGFGWSLLRVRRWLGERATSELMTIALFGSALFVVGSASDLIAMGVGAVLGPLSSLLTGLLSDVGRTVVYGALLTLYPRPGTLALATLTGWIARSFTTGGFSPVDILYVGSSVTTAEGFAWISGLTRSDTWRESSPVSRWARMTVAFGGAGICTTFIGLWLHIVLFRLYFADWYIAMQVAIPGFLYVAIAAGFAVPFADRLRQVQQ